MYAFIVKISCETLFSYLTHELYFTNNNILREKEKKITHITQKSKTYLGDTGQK